VSDAVSDREVTPPASLRAPGILATLAAAAVALAVFAWLQGTFPYLYDGDSYFHVRAAQQLAEHGIQHTFPQAAFSTWSQRYSDKDLLFHVLLVPFVRTGDAQAQIAAGKRAAIALDALVLAALAAALIGLRIRFGPVWIALLCLSHFTLQLYFLPVRPHLLSHALFLLELWALLRGRWVGLLALSALHTWSHSSFVLVPALALAQIVACVLSRERPPWKPLAASVVGIGLATLLHPYFPDNVSVARDQLVHVALAAWGLRGGVPPDLFGSELRPIPLGFLVGSFPGWLPALAGLVPFALPGRTRRLSTPALTLALVAAGFLVLSLLSSRFYPLFIGVAVLLAGKLWTELAADRSWPSLLRERRRGLAAACALVGGPLAAGAYFADPLRVAAVLPRQTNEIVLEPAVRYLDRAADADHVVYHNFWWSFAGLYFFRPEGRYTVALDPIFLYRHDRRLFDAMLAVYRGRGDVYEVVANDFGARWVFVTRLPKNQPFRDLLRDEPRIALRHADEYAEVYEVMR
jgi:hypothetical protein